MAMANRFMTIRDNYHRVCERIATAATGCERDPSDIRLVVVTKTHPIKVIQEVIEAGASHLGENYIEDAIPKIQILRNHQDVNWHMVGHLQSRKVDMLCDYFDYFHSLDSVKLAEKLNRNLEEMNKSLPVWLEFNVGGEESKQGWNVHQESTWGSVLPEIEKIIALPRLILVGIMTIPPYSFDPEDSRPYFRKLRKLQEFIASHFQLLGFRELSMGMSSDFEIAIQEGSTCVRIGQAILGPRSV